MGLPPIPCTRIHIPHDLIHLAQTSGPESDDAKMQIIDLMQPLIQAIIRQYPLPEEADIEEDVKQVAIVGLLEALERYDLGRGTTLITFAYSYIKRAILEVVNGELDYRQSALAYGNFVPEADEQDEATGFLCAENWERIEAVRAFVESLPMPHKQLILQIHLNGRSQTDVAKEMEISPAAVNMKLKRIYHRGRRILARLYLGCYIA